MMEKFSRASAFFLLLSGVWAFSAVGRAQDAATPGAAAPAPVPAVSAPAPAGGTQPQEAPAADAAAAPAPDAAAPAPGGEPPHPFFLTEEEQKIPFKGSFFLTQLEIASIEQALSGRVVGNVAALEQSAKIAQVPGVIRVSGVVYRAAEDWIVWMNGQKVTPDQLLPEIIDIDVEPSSKVHLKWFDAALNKVIRITMRPQQTYDIGTGILLPGMAQ